MALILFDIDKTLLTSNNGYQRHKESYLKAVKKIYNFEPNIGNIETEGMTDRRILIELLNQKGLSQNDLSPKLEECISQMERIYLQSSLTDKVTVLTGVRPLLEHLLRQHTLGVVTGNLEQIGKSKLEEVRISRYFSHNRFGNNYGNKTTLLKSLIEQEKSKGQIYFFGDALKDIEAGVNMGIKTIGVATGNFSRKELEKQGADHTLSSLEDIDEVLSLIE